MNTERFAVDVSYNSFLFNILNFPKLIVNLLFTLPLLSNGAQMYKTYFY